LKWRLEALRTGRSFAEVVMLRSLVYRVEQLFLVHRETSMSLLHVSADRAETQDSDMVAGMLSAIQDFARDSFKTSEGSTLEEFRIGELQVWIAPGRHAYLAAVIRGNPPRELRTTLDETIESVHILKASALASFKGDAADFASLRPELEACLRAQYDNTKPGGKRKGYAWIVIAAVLGLLAGGLSSRSAAKLSGTASSKNCEHSRASPSPRRSAAGFRNRASKDCAIRLLAIRL
jgi:OOP family OmpA-OmpF porin